MEKEGNTEQPVKVPSETMIYVSNLPFSTSNEQLKGLFEGFDVKTAYVATRKNGKSKGFGFVNLNKPEEQKAAIEKVNGKEVEGRVVTAKVAFNDSRRNEKGELKEEFKKQLESPEPSKTAVYVSNLPFALDDEGLKGVFSEFEVKSATVATRSNGRSMGFGFVEFNSDEDLQKALSYDKKSVDGREIAVKVAKNYLGPNRPKRRNKRRPRRMQRRPRFSNFRRNAPQKTVDPQTTLYVGNLPFDLDGNDLTEIFSEFNVKNAYIATQRGGRSKGFGFVEFHNNKSQKNAQEALDQSEVNGRVINVRPARNTNNNNNNSGRRRPPVVRRRRNNNNNRRREPKQKVPSKTLVYVSNLPFSLDDKAFGELFKNYKVVKAYVATRRNGRSKGFGFVEFESNEEQQKAVKESTELVSMERKLNVQVANEVVKEESNNKEEENNN